MTGVMAFDGIFANLRDYIERNRVQPDINRGVRATAGFMVPVIATMWWHLPIEVSIAAITAQNIAMVDIRGSYPLRLSLLLAMTAIFAASGAIGSLGAHSLTWSLIVVAVITLLGGVWRHLSVDYGPSLATTSIFVALLTVVLPGGETAASQHFLSALLGGLWGVVVQVALWPFRAQHPLRRTVSDSWLALSDLLAAMDPATQVTVAARHQAIVEKEVILRTTLDQTTTTLAAQSKRRRAHLQELDELNLVAARIATRLVALNTSLESLMERADFAALAPSFAPVFTSLTNMARGVALTVVSRQPSHLAAVDVRVGRLSNLLRALQERVTTQTSHAPAAAQVSSILQQLAAQLQVTQKTLRATVDRADERMAFPLELFDLQTWTLRPLASALNFHWRPDPALTRFILRLTVLEVLGVAVAKYFHLSRGYWLPLTVLVVMQPDYGSTRLRASQRVIGTVIGGLLASALLWLRMPHTVLLLAMAVTMFGFAFWLKRNYAIAVFFITLFVVLITETSEHVTVGFTLERLLATLGGGALALIAAQIFWPVWERNVFPKLMAQALRRNRDYLTRLQSALAAGNGYEGELVAAKRAAETANMAGFASLQRMSGDPKNQQAGVEAAAVLANGNQRLTRALTVVAVQLGHQAAVTRPELARFIELAEETLEALAHAVETEQPDAERFSWLRVQLNELTLPATGTGTSPADRLEHSASTQFARGATELSAMLLAAQPAIEGSTPPFPVAQSTKNATDK